MNDIVLYTFADPGFSQGGAPTLGAGGAGIKFNFFLRKLHEIEKNLAARGGGAPGSAPLDPPLPYYKTLYLWGLVSSLMVLFYELHANWNIHNFFLKMNTSINWKYWHINILHSMRTTTFSMASLSWFWNALRCTTNNVKIKDVKHWNKC